MQVKIALAQDDDVEAAHRIHRDVLPRPWSITTFKDCCSPPYSLLVAKIAGEVAGYAILLMVADEATLMDIAVRSDYRGLGIGVQLLQTLISRCQQESMQSLWLEVRAGNTIAQNMYAGAGFLTTETRKSYYNDSTGTEDAIIMHLPLASGPDSDMATPGSARPA